MANHGDLCAVCGNAEKTKRLTVGGRSITLCDTHAVWVAEQKPRTLEQLRAVFRPRCGLTTLADRRSLIPRRDGIEQDRRVFPPRPEGRRKGAGRRITDPAD